MVKIWPKFDEIFTKNGQKLTEKLVKIWPKFGSKIDPEIGQNLAKIWVLFSHHFKGI